MKILTELKLNGKGFIDDDFYIHQFEKTINNDINNTQLIYRISGDFRGIGKTKVLNDFSFLLQSIYDDRFKRIIWVTPHTMQEYIGTDVYSPEIFSRVGMQCVDCKSIIIMDEIDVFSDVFNTICGYLDGRHIPIVGFGY